MDSQRGLLGEIGIPCSAAWNAGLFDGRSVWRAHAEGKHKFFAWLFVQSEDLDYR